MTTRTRAGLVTTAAVALMAIGMLLGPGQSGAVERETTCDSVGGQLGCICPDGEQVKLGPTFGEDGPIDYSPAQIAAACGDGPASTTTTTTTSTTTAPTTTTVPAATTTAPPAQVASETVTALPAVRSAPAPTASAGTTTNRAPASTSAAISFTG